MSDQYFAFISYASPYRAWVRALHKNLEAGLLSNDQAGEIFFDETDLTGGKSWIRQLQEGIRSSERLVVVATPEILESKWVLREWESFLLDHSDDLHIVRLLPTELPPFLARLQYVDFVDHDEAKYTERFTQLLGDLLGCRRREPPKLPVRLQIPLSPLQSIVRSKVVSGLAGVLTSKGRIRLAAGALCGDPRALEDAGTPEEVASLLLSLATGDDDPVDAAHRVVSDLAREFEEDWPKASTTLRQLLPLLTRPKAQPEQPAPQGLLASWQRSVVDDHSRLTAYFRERTSDDLLDRVFVHQELRPEELRQEENELFRRLDGQTTIRQLLEDRADAGQSNRWVLLGDPGAGKTTTLRHLAANLARREQPRWIPVFESLPRLMRAEAPWFLDRIESQQRRLGRPSEGLATVLERAGQQGRLLVLFDGLDEVPREDRREAERLIRATSARWPKSALLVTSRPIGYRKPAADFQELQLLPFDAERRREFLARWFGRADGTLDHSRAATAAATLEGDASLRELSSNPLYLTLMALLIEQGASPATNRAQLYGQVFELLLDGKHRPEPQPMECQEAVRAALRIVAFAMTRENRDAEGVTQIEAKLYQPEADEIRDTLERTPRWRRGLRPFLDDLAERTGILGAHDGPETEWRFWHRTFREALAAEELAARYGSDGREVVLAHAREIAGDESRWAEPYALLTGQIAEPDELVKALVKENQALGLRALATAQNLADETIVEVLDLSDDPDKRAEVYLRLPELVGDPQGTLVLVQRLRKRTRNGDDLYHLDLVCELIARQHSKHAVAARALRGRLYDHIPAPPTGLFEKIESIDGEVDLWCEIPAGEYGLGSPKGEEGRYDWEQPPHTVALKSGFAMAAVPITQAQYRAFDPEHRSHFKGDDRPVEQVSWWAAKAFCRWLASHPETSGARLPTEEEWEIACRGGTSTRYWSGDTEEDLARVGWYSKNSGGETHPVARKLANARGLYDVHGNVFEWASSPWSVPREGRVEALVLDPAAADATELLPTLPAATGKPAVSADSSADPAEARRASRVIRGGSCRNDARRTRSAYRDGWNPRNRDQNQGFRVLLPPVPPRSST